MNLKKTLTVAAMAGSITFGATTASALQGALDTLNAHYGTTLTSCSVCHTTAPVLNVFGAAYKAAGGDKSGAPAPNWTTLDAGDADGDGVTNAAEFAAGTDPAVDPTAPAPTTSSGGGGGCVTSAVTTPLMMVLAMLSLGFFVRRKKS